MPWVRRFVGEGVGAGAGDLAGWRGPARRPRRARRDGRYRAHCAAGTIGGSRGGVPGRAGCGRRRGVRPTGPFHGNPCGLGPPCRRHDGPARDAAAAPVTLWQAQGDRRRLTFLSYTRRRGGGRFRDASCTALDGVGRDGPVGAEERDQQKPDHHPEGQQAGEGQGAEKAADQQHRQRDRRRTRARAAVPRASGRRFAGCCAPRRSRPTRAGSPRSGAPAARRRSGPRTAWG